MPDTYWTARAESMASLGRSLESHLWIAHLRRDEAIQMAYAEGVKPAELARITGLSRQRIHQICDLSRDRSAS